MYIKLLQYATNTKSKNNNHFRRSKLHSLIVELMFIAQSLWGLDTQVLRVGNLLLLIVLLVVGVSISITKTTNNSDIQDICLP